MLSRAITISCSSIPSLSAISQTETLSYTFDVSNALSEIEGIKNNQDNKLTAVLHYDNNNKLVGAKNSLDSVKIPDGTKTVKVYMYDKAPINIPLEAKIDDSQKIKVLAIGNSYAVDAFSYLEEIARNIDH